MDNPDLNTKATEVNDRLKNMCNDRNFPYIDHSSIIDVENHLGEGNLHLNRYGTIALANNFSNFLVDHF